MAKKGLGKGLSALLPAEKNSTENNSAPIPASSAPGEKGKNVRAELLVSPDKLLSNPNQPRKVFDRSELDELAESIKQQGIIQPIIAEDRGDGNFIIIAGERRTRAAKMAGLREVPVILRKYSNEKQMEVSLIENIQRSNLNPIEEAAAYRQLMENNKLSQDEVASRVGKNRATVANALRLLRLPKNMQEGIQKSEISPGHARAILSLTDSALQEELYREIVKKSLSVRDAEKKAALLSEQNKKTKKPAVKKLEPDLASMQDKFISILGTKVVIKGNLTRGNILIDYYSMEDLDRIYELLNGKH